jgi:hypothetical protein
VSDLLTLDAAERLYEELLDGAAEYEQRDLCSEDFLDALREAVNSDGGEPHPEWKAIADPMRATSVPHDGKILKTVRGMGTVYDWRDSSWTRANGGRITARLGVQHIPVIPNVDGFGDLITLVNVLLAQGLMVQQGTDAEGNVGLFVPGNILCFQARGANQVSWGTEHMHMKPVGEPWSKRQLRASAWIIQLNRRQYGTGRGRASVGDGSGVVRVIRGGQTTHRRISECAGFHDRSDPNGDVDTAGHLPAHYDFEYVDHCVTFFERHGHFEGA